MMVWIVHNTALSALLSSCVKKKSLCLQNVHFGNHIQVRLLCSALYPSPVVTECAEKAPLLPAALIWAALAAAFRTYNTVSLLQWGAGGESINTTLHTLSFVKFVEEIGLETWHPGRRSPRAVDRQLVPHLECHKGLEASTETRASRPIKFLTRKSYLSWSCQHEVTPPGCHGCSRHSGSTRAIPLQRKMQRPKGKTKNFSFKP